MTIQDLNTIKGNPFKEKRYDVCICGTGPAGMTLALKLSRNFKVCLLEAGGLYFSEESQSLYKGEVTGEDYADLDQIRFRQFGGSSVAWGGTCRPLDARDFKHRKLVKNSGWPISREDVDPYLAEAREILDANHGEKEVCHHEGKDWLPRLEGYEEMRYWESYPRTNVGVKYREFVENNQNLDCFLNANVTDIRLGEDLQTVTGFEVTSYHDQKYIINAREFAVAAGGIENPRILLNAKNQIKAGIGNEKGLVGRFFCEHPHHQLGEFILEDEPKKVLRAEQKKEWKPIDHIGRFFKPTDAMMVEKKVLNHSLEMQPGPPPEPTSSDGFFKSTLRSMLCAADYIRDTAEAIKGGAVTCDHKVDGYVTISAEQEPNYESRVRLSKQKDRFGLQKADLYWYHSDLDRKTVRDAAYYAAKKLALTHTGRVRLERWLREDDVHLPGPHANTASFVYGPHHMCSTRMSDSPETGVVDSDCKVFSCNNLYIAGSSVFSSGGFANPTLTIVQLALRLAEHLDGKLKTTA
jgi:choline dehydrogenase-like flavoprotein